MKRLLLTADNTHVFRKLSGEGPKNDEGQIYEYIMRLAGRENYVY